MKNENIRDYKPCPYCDRIIESSILENYYKMHLAVAHDIYNKDNIIKHVNLHPQDSWIYRVDLADKPIKVNIPEELYSNTPLGNMLIKHLADEIAKQIDEEVLEVMRKRIILKAICKRGVFNKKSWEN